MKTLFVLACGAISSCLVAVALAALQASTGRIFFGYSWFVVLPVGALVSGIFAGSGYYLACHTAQCRPGRFTLAGILGIATATFFLIYFLQYPKDNTFASFTSYLAYALTHAKMPSAFPGDSIGAYPMGLLAYLAAATQILGLASGGFMFYATLREEPFCEGCRKYFRTEDPQSRFLADTAAAEEVIRLAHTTFESGRYQELLEVYPKFGVAREQSTSKFLTRLELRQCPGCGATRLHFTAQRKQVVGRQTSWTKMKEAAKSGYSRSRLQLRAS
ncbi:hypothetical protein Terro_0445 [Terriglobus roseus DSM 18391]|uniref:Uncharacterized protein n=1 Tax=Terriglobus roseus (strain DSM 18391 / NRRL B-41598 / KBS 63) TaxID=926566 RepID=I3ZC21_TERRK|nr:hypothetical protein [Terriglobus roseus]AFL86789.1 hypothetical protein Terro_0445 [Terriglobus roseus DSM 18391]